MRQGEGIALGCPSSPGLITIVVASGSQSIDDLFDTDALSCRRPCLRNVTACVGGRAHGRADDRKAPTRPKGPVAGWRWSRGYVPGTVHMRAPAGHAARRIGTLCGVRDVIPVVSASWAAVT